MGSEVSNSSQCFTSRSFSIPAYLRVLIQIMCFKDKFLFLVDDGLGSGRSRRGSSSRDAGRALQRVSAVWTAAWARTAGDTGAGVGAPGRTGWFRPGAGGAARRSRRVLRSGLGAVVPFSDACPGSWRPPALRPRPASWRLPARTVRAPPAIPALLPGKACFKCSVHIWVKYFSR